MNTLARRIPAIGLLALVAVALSCGGGSNSWVVGSDEGDWRIEMRINTSGCKPSITRMWNGELSDNGTFLRLTVHLETFVDCPFGDWRLNGTHESAMSVVMDDLVNTYVCQFDDRWNLEVFSVTSFRLQFPGDTNSFSASGDFTGQWEDGTNCNGTIQLFGMK